ncbi:MAG: outer membrane protein assembly factor BamD [Candidatus Acidiferrales bacterium]
MKKRHFAICAFAALLTGSLGASAYAGQKVKVTKVKPAKKPAADTTAESAEPDKILYERAVTDIKHSKYTEARLSFQTLVNTYPDSEYLAKAKLGVADSYYKEGGTSNLTQAIDEYKNFIVFFPFLDEAAYAQMQVGMCHYRMMSKSDRDNSQGEGAEDEFQAFLLKYPQNPLVPKAEQDLRNVQEVVADGYYRVARFYYLKRDYRASAARLVDLTQRYPLYSQSDVALAMLGDIYMRAKQVSKNEDDKNHWADLAGRCYSRIVQDYPLSSQAALAKDHLKALGMPVPQADPEALARMQKQQLYEKHHRESLFAKFPMGMLESRPDVIDAARSGEPNLNPPDDLVSATQVLKQGAAGPTFTVTAQNPGASDTATDSDGPVVEGATSGAGSDAPSTGVGAEIIAAPASAGESSSSDANSSSAPVSTAAPAEVPAAAGPPAASTLSSVPGTGPAASITAQPTASSEATQPTGAATVTSRANAQANAPAPATKADSKTESTSKKKKGLKKIVPW